MAGKNIYYGGIYKARPYAIAANTASTVIDLSESNVYHITLSTDTVLTLNNPTTTNYILHISQSGYNDITFPDNIKWHDGAPPVLSPEPGALDIITLSFDGTIYYGTTSLNHRSGLLLDEFEGAAAAYSLRALTTASTDYIPLAGDYGAEVAYSLRQVVSSYTGPVVRVRRSSDNAEADFTPAEVSDGTMTDWVNEEVVIYTSDFTSGNEDLWENNNVTPSDGVTIAGVSDCYRATAKDMDGATPMALGLLNSLAVDQTYRVQFDYYIPSTNTELNAIRIYQKVIPPQIEAVTDSWTSVTYENQQGNHDDVFFQGWDTIGSTASLTASANGDVFYLKNIVITQITADGLVTTWYDQSGNNNHATQAVAAKQPKLIDAGSLVLENGEPAIESDGVDDYMQSPTGVLGTVTDLYAFTVGAYLATGAASDAIFGVSAGSYGANQDYFILYQSSGNNRVIASSSLGAEIVDAGAVDTSQHLYELIYDGGNSLTFSKDTLDTSETATVPASVTPDQEIDLFFGDNGGTPSFIGAVKLQELIIFDSDQSFNRKKIEYEINAHYGIYTQWDRKSLVRVRRSSDNAERDFTQREIIDGTLEDWVNEEVVVYTSDFTSGNEDLVETRGTSADGVTVLGVDDAYSFTLTNGISTHFVTKLGVFDSGKRYNISFDYYIPNGQALNGISFRDDVSTWIENLTNTGSWQNYSYNGVPSSNSLRFWALNGNSVTVVGNDGDVFYLKNIVVTQTTADGFVTTWYDQSLNNNHAVQTTAANQPKIVDAGSLVTEGGTVSMEFDTSDDNMEVTLASQIVGSMLMGGKTTSEVYEVDIPSGVYDIKPMVLGLPKYVSSYIIWGRTLSAEEKIGALTASGNNSTDLNGGVTNMSYFWYNRAEITRIPEFNLVGVTNLFRTWQGCSSLQEFPLLDTSSITSFNLTWSGCNSLTEFPLLDGSNVVNAGGGWGICSGLTEFPAIDLPKATSVAEAWRGCTGLTAFPVIDIGSATGGVNMTSAWYQCSGLISFPALDLSKGNDFGGTWFACTSLTDFPANMFDSTIATDFANAFTNTNLTSQSIENIVVSIDTAGQSNGTLNISGGGNATTATAQTAIDNLRAKGWTVTVPDGY